MWIFKNETNINIKQISVCVRVCVVMHACTYIIDTQTHNTRNTHIHIRTHAYLSKQILWCNIYCFLFCVSQLAHSWISHLDNPLFAAIRYINLIRDECMEQSSIRGDHDKVSYRRYTTAEWICDDGEMLSQIRRRKNTPSCKGYRE